MSLVKTDRLMLFMVRIINTQIQDVGKMQRFYCFSRWHMCVPLCSAEGLNRREAEIK
jgi:hypothetical protein